MHRGGSDVSSRHGSCLCGAVRFEVTAPLREVIVCHCTQCRKTSGHCWAASSVPLDRFRLTEDRGLAWYRSSPSARRGFCRHCGASLFWEPDAEGRMSFSPSALDVPTGVTTARHIFVETAGDYYAPEGPPPAPGPVPARLSASCLCGGVRMTLPGPAGDITACHCTQCRKTSGLYSASFDADESSVVYEARTTLAEYTASGGSRRSFCTGCGSSVAFRAPDGSFSVEAGLIDGPTGGTLSQHIFVADRGDFYTITDGLTQFDGAG